MKPHVFDTLFSGTVFFIILYLIAYFAFWFLDGLHVMLLVNLFYVLVVPIGLVSAYKQSNKLQILPEFLCSKSLECDYFNQRKNLYNERKLYFIEFGVDAGLKRWPRVKKIYDPGYNLGDKMFADNEQTQPMPNGEYRFKSDSYKGLITIRNGAIVWIEASPR